MSDDYLVYCNGDSYSNDQYHPSLLNNAYSNRVCDYLNGYLINNSINGSSNRRIIRNTVHDLILQRQLNPKQKIIALLGLTFEIRSELWLDDESLIYNKRQIDNVDSNFQTHQFSNSTSWHEKLRSNQDIATKVGMKRWHKKNKFHKSYSDGRAYFYSPYAERINLYSDLITLTALLDKLDIGYIIFQSPGTEMLEEEYLLDFFKDIIKQDNRILDIDNFSFLNWAKNNNFIPLDFKDRPDIGHYGADAHKAFAEQILIPKLKETEQI